MPLCGMLSSSDSTPQSAHFCVWMLSLCRYASYALIRVCFYRGPTVLYYTTVFYSKSKRKFSYVLLNCLHYSATDWYITKRYITIWPMRSSNLCSNQEKCNDLHISECNGSLCLRLEATLFSKIYRGNAEGTKG